MEVELLRADHLQRIVVQSAQAGLRAEIEKPGYLEAITYPGCVAYALVHEGDVLGCYGAQAIWAGRAVVWTLLSDQSQRYMLTFHRIAKGFLAQLPVRRVEAYVASGFEQGVHWVDMLGFEYEGCMRGFFPNGEDAQLYARVKNGYESISDKA